MPYFQCTQVTPDCPVSATTYGYRPNLGGNAFFLAIFACCTIGQLVLGLWKRVPAFGFAVTIGCLGEAIGYVGRLMMHDNPWSRTGFKVQIVCLILSPSFLAAGIYLTLKHLVLVFGSEKSRLAPKLYTWIFIGCDIFSIVLQAAGGGIASGNEAKLVDIGDDVMIAGICFQVATMLVCLMLAIDFGRNMVRSGNGSDQSEKGKLYRQYAKSRRFHFYVICSSVAFVCILIRSIYRIPEMAGGWGNPRMQDEPVFLVLDGAMIAIASILLTIAHPGIFFPLMRAKLRTSTDSE